MIKRHNRQTACNISAQQKVFCSFPICSFSGLYHHHLLAIPLQQHTYLQKPVLPHARVFYAASVHAAAAYILVTQNNL